MNDEAVPSSDVAVLTEAIRSFTHERDWDQFHSPKNLAMALAGEVGELVAELQWLEREDLEEALAPGTELWGRFASELADVFIYLLRLADRCDIDPVSAAYAKLHVNRDRYPVEEARGRAGRPGRSSGNAAAQDRNPHRGRSQPPE